MIVPPPVPRYVDVVEEPPPAAEAEAPPPGTLLAALGAYPTRRAAEEALLVVQLSSRPDALPAHVRPERAAGRVRFRVVAGPLDPAAANRLCGRLRAAGEPCAVSEVDPAPPDAPPG